MKQNDLAKRITTSKDSDENSIPSDSTSKTLPISTAQPRELASRFAVFRTPIEQIRETLVANLGENNIDLSDLESIKIPSGGGLAWAVPGIAGEEIVTELSGVILRSREVRKFWKEPIEHSNGAMPPDCRSPDAQTGFGDPGGDCHSCRFAQFGSASTGRGQACKLVIELFFLRPENLLPDVINIPSGSQKSLMRFLRRLTAPCFSLVTMIGLEKTRNSQGIEYSRATFTTGEVLSHEEAKRATEYASLMMSLIDAARPAPLATTPKKEDGEVV